MNTDMTNAELTATLKEAARLLAYGPRGEKHAPRLRFAARRLEALTAAAARTDAMIQQWRETGNPPSMTEWLALQAECRRALDIDAAVSARRRRA